MEARWPQSVRDYLKALANLAPTLRRYLLGCISWRVWVERRPTAIAICRTTKSGVYGLVALQNLSGHCCARVIDPGCDESAAAPDTFGIKIGIVLGNACSGERPDKTASCTPYNRPCHNTGGRSGEPTRGNDRSDAGDR